MKALIQRVSRASVSVGDTQIAAINQGLLILLGVGEHDKSDNVVQLVEKIIHLRIFSDEKGKMNQSLCEINGAVLLVSQFTLFADTRRGRRPSFIHAAKPDIAQKLYEFFKEELARQGVKKVVTGEFGAYMQVSLVNDGPVTIMLDTEEL